MTRFIILFLLLFVQLPAISSELLLAKESKKAKDSNKEVKEDNKEEKKKEVKINEKEYQPVLLGTLLENPKDFISKKIKFKGKFSSFSTLALDYPPALRKSKDHISICIFRPDSKIPLSELKLAFPVKDAKENETIRDLQEGDLLEIYAEVFSAALDEPWADIIHLKKLESAAKKQEENLAQEKEQKEDKIKKRKSKDE